MRGVSVLLESVFTAGMSSVVTAAVALVVVKWGAIWDTAAHRRIIIRRMAQLLPSHTAALVFTFNKLHTCLWVSGVGDTDGFPLKFFVGRKYDDVMQGIPHVIDAADSVWAGTPTSVSYEWGITGHPWRMHLVPNFDQYGIVDTITGIAWRIYP